MLSVYARQRCLQRAIQDLVVQFEFGLRTQSGGLCRVSGQREPFCLCAQLLAFASQAAVCIACSWSANDATRYIAAARTGVSHTASKTQLCPMNSSHACTTTSMHDLQHPTSPRHDSEQPALVSVPLATSAPCCWARSDCRQSKGAPIKRRARTTLLGARKLHAACLKLRRAPPLSAPPSSCPVTAPQSSPPSLATLQPQEPASTPVVRSRQTLALHTSQAALDHQQRPPHLPRRSHMPTERAYCTCFQVEGLQQTYTVLEGEHIRCAAAPRCLKCAHCAASSWGASASDAQRRASLQRTRHPRRGLHGHHAWCTRPWRPRQGAHGSSCAGACTLEQRQRAQEALAAPLALPWVYTEAANPCSRSYCLQEHYEQQADTSCVALYWPWARCQASPEPPPLTPRAHNFRKAYPNAPLPTANVTVLANAVPSALVAAPAVVAP
jgi:hypothetical protein